MRVRGAMMLLCAALAVAARVLLVSAACADMGGQCLNQNTASCNNGAWVTGQCSGASNIVCCVPAPQCTAQSGRCINTNSETCSGTLQSNLCPGTSSIKCCVGYAQSSACTSAGGSCKFSSACTAGSLQGGLCPGPSNWMCCVPPPPTPTGDACYIMGLTGSCSTQSACGSGAWTSGFCDGASTIRCCTATAPDISRNNDYAYLWNNMHITQSARINSAASTISSNKARYTTVASLTGVPWQVIGAIHMLEGSGDFTTHLHNGDPLTGYTVHVPAGRPTTHAPPFTWEESAVDALTLQKNGNWAGTPSWDIVSTLAKLEKYNGLGYKLYHNINSPYLWAGTNWYVRGKYVADGSWDANAVSSQAGAAGILKALGYA